MTTRAWAATIGGLTIVAAALRVVRLDAGLWYDEIVTLVEFVRPSLPHIVSAFPDTNNHPLYSVLAHLSIAVCGEHAWSLRVPAVLFGVASVPMLFALGKEVTTPVEATSASALLAVSYHGVWFSQNARGYTALLFWSLLATWILIRLQRIPSPALAIAYGAVAALGIYTHLTMAFVIAAHALLCAWWQVGRKPAQGPPLSCLVLAFGVSAALSVALYAPMLGQVWHVAGEPRQAATSVATPMWAVAQVLKGLRVGFGTIGVLAAAVLALVGAVSYGRGNRAATLLFVAPGAVTLAGVLLTHAPIRPRFFFFLLGFALLLLVRGAIEAGAFVGRRRQQAPFGQGLGLAAVAVIALLSLSSVPYAYAHPKQDFEGALEFLRRHRTESERVATAGLASYPYTRYYQLPWSPVETREQLDGLRSHGQRVWVVYSFPEYMDPGLLDSVHHDCAPQRVLPGTLDGGDVIVCSMEGR